MKYLIDFTALALFYGFVCFGRWRRRGKGVLLVNTLLYLYLSFVLYFTLMPILTRLPSVLSQSYRPMNMTAFIDVALGRGDFVRQIVLNMAMTVPFGFLFPLTKNGKIGFGKTILFCFFMSLGIELLQPFFARSASDVPAGHGLAAGPSALTYPIQEVS